jgi:group I intron endonuclease
MTTGIYKITIEGCERFYIGSALDFAKRRSHHISELRGSRHRNTHLQRAYEKYGEDKFSFEIVEECATDDLIAREQVWIDKYDFSALINICPTAGNTLGRKHSDETRKLISENHYDVSGKSNPQYGLRGELSPNWGRKHSDETRRKISEANKGKEPWSKGKKRPKHSEKMAGENNHFYGKKHTDEAREAISKAARKRSREKGGKKLTFAIANEIRMRYNTGNITITALAKEYGLSRTYCGLLLKGRYWNDGENKE